MDSIYLPSIGLDAFTLLVCVGLLIRRRLLTTLHPGFVYLGFHVFCVTARLFMLLLGGSPMPAVPGMVSREEMVRAAAYGDLALFTMTWGWILADRKAKPRGSVSRAASDGFSKEVLLSAALITGAIGAFGLATVGLAAVQTKVDLVGWSTSSYLFMTVSWLVQAMLLLHFTFGFPRWLLLGTCFVLFITMYNAARFAVILGLLFLFFTYVSRTGRRWLPGRMILVGLLVVVLYFPMKAISKSILHGDDVSTILQTGSDFYSVSFRDEKTAEVAFLDMGACVMTLSDDYGSRLWGEPWVSIATLPIPHQLWLDKPPINDYLRRLSTTQRPMYTMGMTPLLFGDAYLNFGTIGVILWPLIVGYALGRIHKNAMLHSHFSPSRLVYLTLLATSLQLYRDCLVQAVLFPLTSYLPLMVVACVQWLANLLRRNRLSFVGPMKPRLFIHGPQKAFTMRAR
jgi:hypothetical protein